MIRKRSSGVDGGDDTLLPTEECTIFIGWAGSVTSHVMRPEVDMQRFFGLHGRKFCPTHDTSSARAMPVDHGELTSEMTGMLSN
jgi:hypothetical protein